MNITQDSKTFTSTAKLPSAPWSYGFLFAIFLAMSGPLVSFALAASPEVTRAEEMIWGDGDHSSSATGQLILERAVANGDVSAMTTLGEHLVYGWVLPKDVEAGVQLLAAAADKGSAEAQNVLGQVYLWGTAVDTDASRAERYLLAASKQGQPEAMLTLGQQLVSGGVFSPDLPTGLRWLERSAEANNSKALVALGEIYWRGKFVERDPDRAQQYFEDAAALGDGSGLTLMGTELMWREINATKAEEMLQRAGELGATEAYVRLAEGAMYGYLGGGSLSRKKYDGYAAQAMDAGENRLAVLEAERKLWGIGTRADGAEAVAILTTAAETGNADAAKYLIGLLRDGNNLNVRRSKMGAEDALNRFGDLLSEKERSQYALTLKAAAARTPERYAPVAEAFEQQSKIWSLWFGMELYKANPNVAFYILQRRLADEGKYAGALNGYATRLTLDAVNRACREKLDRSLCDDNVMRPDVIGALLAQ